MNIQERQVIVPVLTNNSYFAHHENILLAALADERVGLREVGIKLILQARNRLSQQEKFVRQFIPPKKLNLDAKKNYFELVDLPNMTDLTPPPLLSDLSDMELLDKGKEELKNSTFFVIHKMLNIL